MLPELLAILLSRSDHSTGTGPVAMRDANMPEEIRPRPYSGIYSVRDAALFLRATTPPADVPIPIWKIRRERFIGPSSRHIHYWIRRSAKIQGRQDHFALNFEQMIRARMIVFFRAQGLSLQKIMAAESEMQRVTRQPQPFVTEQLWSSSSDVFFHFEELMRTATRPHQLAFEKVIREFMTPINHGLEFDESGMTQRWRPMPGVLIDPEIQFGSPCIEGTRVETEALWSFHQNGEDARSLADLYALEPEQIEAGLDWEGTLARAAEAA